MICSLRQHGMAVKAFLILNGTEEGGYIHRHDMKILTIDCNRVATPDHVDSASGSLGHISPPLNPKKLQCSFPTTHDNESKAEIAR